MTLEALTAAQALEVDAHCDDFERHWHRARRRHEPLPDVAAFVRRAPPALQAALTDSLAALERDLQSGSVLPLLPGLHCEAEIGRGGMGVVYRARETSGRVVAVKVIHGVEALAFATFATLDHPHLLRLERWGQHEGLPYLVMPLAEGGDLRERLASAPVADWRAAARVMEKVARAVGYLHRQGILHRDLKPSNILLARADTLEPLVCDFGLAGRIGEQRAGGFVGTAAYMAPEQRAGGCITPAADLWSLGAVLAEWVPDSPLTPIYRRCLAIDPPRRYPSADALADDLAQTA